MSKNFRYEDTQDRRNYELEARNLIKALNSNQVYEMYEIVNKQLQRSNSETRDKELIAVRDAIEQLGNVDESRLRQIKFGYKSSMAADANPKDGYSKPARKKS